MTMRIPRQKIFVSLRDIWVNKQQPDRTLGSKIQLTAKNGLNNYGVIKYRLTNPTKPLDINSKRQIITNTNNTINNVKGIARDLTNKPAETISKGGASFVKNTIKAPVNSTIVNGIRIAPGIIAGQPWNPLAWANAGSKFAEKTINNIPILKKSIEKVDSVVGSEKLANKINPEKVGEVGKRLDNTVKKGAGQLRGLLGKVGKFIRR